MFRKVYKVVVLDKHTRLLGHCLHFGNLLPNLFCREKGPHLNLDSVIFWESHLIIENYQTMWDGARGKKVKDPLKKQGGYQWVVLKGGTVVLMNSQNYPLSRQKEAIIHGLLTSSCYRR